MKTLNSLKSRVPMKFGKLINLFDWVTRIDWKLQWENS